MFSWATPLRLSAPRLFTPMTAMLSFSPGRAVRANIGTANAEAADAARNFRRVTREGMGTPVGEANAVWENARRLEASVPMTGGWRESESSRCIRFGGR